jgi:hypothetical protein
MRDKIKFEPGVAVRALLDKNESKPIEGRNGTDYMRVVDNDERIMFCPEELEEAIHQSGAAAGDVIQITQKGKGRTARWEVGIIGDTRQGQPRPAAPPAAPQPAATPIAPARTITAPAVEMTAAFIAAIQATREAEAYAAREGLRNFHACDTDTITRIALTIFIQGAKR